MDFKYELFLKAEFFTLSQDEVKLRKDVFLMIYIYNGFVVPDNDEKPVISMCHACHYINQAR